MADSYVKDAFFMPPNLLGLGASALVSAIVFPPLLLGVAALEGIYLWQVSTNPRFQRMIRSRRR
jgi:hypothetical protein